MRYPLRLASFVVAALAVLPLSAQVTYVPIVAAASPIADSGGNALQNGAITFTPGDNSGNPLAARGVLSRSTTCLVAAGAITTQPGGATCKVADALVSNPQLCYKVTIFDKLLNATVPTPGQICAQPTGSGADWTGSAWDYSLFVPNETPATLAQVGPTGPAGPTGLTGPAGANAILGLALGAWSSSTSYALGNIVTYGGNSYDSLVASNTGHEPDISPSDWGMLANLTNLPVAFASQSAASPNAVYASQLPVGFNTVGGFGDSLFQGAQDAAPRWLTLLQGDIDQITYNEGITGQTTGQICARMGACPTSNTAGITIPTSGGVTVAFPSHFEPAFNVNFDAPLFPNGVLGYFQGYSTYPGYLMDNGSHVYTFTPTSYPGSPVSVAANTPWIPILPAGVFNGCVVIQGGHNDIGAIGSGWGTVVEANIASMVAYVSARTSCYAVWGVFNDASLFVGNATYNLILSVNATLASLYTSHFIDIRTMLVNDYNPANPVDVINYGNGVIPYTVTAQDAPGTLTAAITSTSTCTLPLSTSPTALYNVVLVDSEYIQLQSGSAGSYTCVRGYAGSTAATHLINATYTMSDSAHIGLGLASNPTCVTGTACVASMMATQLAAAGSTAVPPLASVNSLVQSAIATGVPTLIFPATAASADSFASTGTGTLSPSTLGLGLNFSKSTGHSNGIVEETDSSNNYYLTAYVNNNPVNKGFRLCAYPAGTPYSSPTQNTLCTLIPTPTANGSLLAWPTSATNVDGFFGTGTTSLSTSALGLGLDFIQQAGHSNGIAEETDSSNNFYLTFFINNDSLNKGVQFCNYAEGTPYTGYSSNINCTSVPMPTYNGTLTAWPTTTTNNDGSLATSKALPVSNSFSPGINFYSAGSAGYSRGEAFGQDGSGNYSVFHYMPNASGEYGEIWCSYPGGTALATPSQCGSEHKLPRPTINDLILIGVEATSASIGGSSLAVNACSYATVTVTGAVAGDGVGVTPSTDPNTLGTRSYSWYGTVTATNTVTVSVCANIAGTPAGTTYKVVVSE